MEDDVWFSDDDVDGSPSLDGTSISQHMNPSSSSSRLHAHAPLRLVGYAAERDTTEAWDDDFQEPPVATNSDSKSSASPDKLFISALDQLVSDFTPLNIPCLSPSELDWVLKQYEDNHPSLFEDVQPRDDDILWPDEADPILVERFPPSAFHPMLQAEIADDPAVEDSIERCEWALELARGKNDNDGVLDALWNLVDLCSKTSRRKTVPVLYRELHACYASRVTVAHHRGLSTAERDTLICSHSALLRTVRWNLYLGIEVESQTLAGLESFFKLLSSTPSLFDDEGVIAREACFRIEYLALRSLYAFHNTHADTARQFAVDAAKQAAYEWSRRFECHSDITVAGKHHGSRPRVYSPCSYAMRHRTIPEIETLIAETVALYLHAEALLRERYGMQPFDDSDLPSLRKLTQIALSFDGLSALDKDVISCAILRCIRHSSTIQKDLEATAAAADIASTSDDEDWALDDSHADRPSLSKLLDAAITIEDDMPKKKAFKSASPTAPGTPTSSVLPPGTAFGLAHVSDNGNIPAGSQSSAPGVVEPDEDLDPRLLPNVLAPVGGGYQLTQILRVPRPSPLFSFRMPDGRKSFREASFEKWLRKLSDTHIPSLTGSTVSVQSPTETSVSSVPQTSTSRRNENLVLWHAGETSDVYSRLKVELSYVDPLSPEWSSMVVSGCRELIARRAYGPCAELLGIFFDALGAFYESANSEDDDVHELGVLAMDCLEIYGRLLLEDADSDFSARFHTFLHAADALYKCPLPEIVAGAKVVCSRVSTHYFVARGGSLEDQILEYVKVWNGGKGSDSREMFECAVGALVDLHLLCLGKSPLSWSHFPLSTVPTASGPPGLSATTTQSFTDSVEAPEELAEFLTRQCLELLGSDISVDEVRLKCLRDAVVNLELSLARAKLLYALALSNPSSADCEAILFETVFVLWSLSTGRSDVGDEDDAFILKRSLTFSVSVPPLCIIDPLHNTFSVHTILPLYAHVLRDKYAYARALYDALLRMHGSSSSLLRTVALLAYNNRDSRTALDLYTRLLASAVASRNANEVLFFALQCTEVAAERGEFNRGITALKAALRFLAPDIPVDLWGDDFKLDTTCAQLHLAYARALGDSLYGLEPAISHVERLMQLDIPTKKRDAMHLELASLYIKKDWVAKALTLLTDIETVSDDDFIARLHELYFKCYLRGRLYEEALKQCDIALAAVSTHFGVAQWHVRKARVYLAVMRDGVPCSNLSSTDVLKLCIRHAKRAYELFRTLGDDLHVAKAVSLIARAQIEHLMPSVVYENKSVESLIEIAVTSSEGEDKALHLSIDEIAEPCFLALRIASDFMHVPLYIESLLLCSDVRYLQKRFRASKKYADLAKQMLELVFFKDHHVFLFNALRPSIIRSVLNTLRHLLRLYIHHWPDEVESILIKIVTLEDYLVESRKHFSGVATSDDDSVHDDISKSDNFGAHLFAGPGRHSRSASTSQVPHRRASVIRPRSVQSGHLIAPRSVSVAMAKTEPVEAERVYSLLSRLKNTAREFTRGSFSRQDLRRKNEALLQRICTLTRDPASGSISTKPVLPLVELFNAGSVDTLGGSGSHLGQPSVPPQSTGPSQSPYSQPLPAQNANFRRQLLFIVEVPQFLLLVAPAHTQFVAQRQDRTNAPFWLRFDSPIRLFLRNMLLQGRDEKLPRELSGTEHGMPKLGHLAHYFNANALKDFVFPVAQSASTGSDVSTYVPFAKFPWKNLDSFYEGWSRRPLVDMQPILLITDVCHSILPWEGLFASPVLRLRSFAMLRTLTVAAGLQAKSPSRQNSFAHDLTVGTTSSTATTMSSSGTATSSEGSIHTSASTPDNLNAGVSTGSSSSSSGSIIAGRLKARTSLLIAFAETPEALKNRSGTPDPRPRQILASLSMGFSMPASDALLRSAISPTAGVSRRSGSFPTVFEEEVQSLDAVDVLATPHLPFHTPLIKPGKNASAYKKKYRLIRFVSLEEDYLVNPSLVLKYMGHSCVVLCSWGDMLDLSPLLRCICEKLSHAVLMFVPQSRIKDVAKFVHRAADSLQRDDDDGDWRMWLFICDCLLRRLGVPCVLMGSAQWVAQSIATSR